MVIAVHDNSKKRNLKGPEHRFIQKLCYTCSLNHPEDQFFFISPNVEQTENSENLKFIGLEKPRFPLLRKKRYSK
ncbi:MAG: hypothetical protein ACXWCZ_02675, partial [Flavisolibacter sp.]